MPKQNQQPAEDPVEEKPVDERPVSELRDDESQAEEPQAGELAENEGGEGPDAAEPALSVEELVNRLEAARKKADDHWEALLRNKAEMENLRKRSARDVENAHKYGLERFAAELLPVKDSMEMGLGAAGDEAGVEQIREGMELTLKMFNGVLEKFGVEEISPHGEAFNPEYHQAMSMQEDPNFTAGTVLTVVQKGLSLNGRLVRPAMVIVAK